MVKLKRKAFTLIELLVVISIIALLLSVLVPSLGKAKKSAKAVVCKSNLHQWGMIWNLYLNDHKNRFPSGNEGLWVEPLRPYYKDGGEDMRMCPTSTKSEDEGGKIWFIAWDVDNGFADPPEVYRGSYGINNWLYDCPDPVWWGNDTTHNWRRSDITGTSRIPLFMDCWRWGGNPYDTDVPYENPPQTEREYLHGINRFCLDRHGGNINVLFLDMSVSKTDLKELWKLKWSKNFDTNNRQTRDDAVWPDWMQ